MPSFTLSHRSIRSLGDHQFTKETWSTTRTFLWASQRKLERELLSQPINLLIPCLSTPVLCPGHKLLPTQKGISTYMVSPNRLMPFAHAGHNAVFNTARRMRGQFWYVVPPFVAAYLLARWMDERYVVVLPNTTAARKLVLHAYD